MKLMTNKGQLALPDDFSFDFLQASPLFSGEGTSSIPATLPATPDTLNKLGHPQRLSKKDAFLRRLPAQLVAGAFTKSGQLVIDSISRADGITASLALNESDVYAQFKERSIRELFTTDKDIHDSYLSESDPVAALYEHIYKVYTKQVTADYAVFPVASGDIESPDLVNAPDTSSTSDPYPLSYASRTIKEAGDAVAVPEGYGISVYLYLGKFIDMLFGKMGYTVASNPFDTVNDPPLSKIVLLNNVADTICRGYILYGDIVPECTVSEFLEFLAKRFNAFVIVHPESRSVDVVLMSDALRTIPDLDLTGHLDGDAVYELNDPQDLKITHDATLDGAAPPEETLQDFHAKYPVMQELTEAGFATYTCPYAIVYRKALGTYYKVMRDIYAKSGNYSRVADHKMVRLGSNLFARWRRKTDSPLEIASPDVSAVMASITLSDTGVFVAPFVGDVIHRSTATADENAGEQKICLAYAAGRAIADGISDGKYYYGTTQKYNNAGSGIWCAYNLNASDYYDYLWRLYDRILQDCPVTVKAKIDLTAEQVLALDVSRLKHFRGAAVIIRSLEYNVGRNLVCGEMQMTPVRDSGATDDEITFESQLFKWTPNWSNIDAWLAELAASTSGSGINSYWGWKFADTSRDYIYLPPPSAAGLTGFRQTVAIKATRYSQEDNSVLSEQTADKEIWYDSTTI